MAKKAICKCDLRIISQSLGSVKMLLRQEYLAWNILFTEDFAEDTVNGLENV